MIPTGVRSRYPVAQSTAYFNHAGVCPLGVHVVDAIKCALDHFCRRGAVDYADLTAPLQTLRASAARLMGAEAAEIALVKNTTQGLIIASQSIAWRPGDNCIITNVEFPANVYPWLHLERRGVEVRMVPAVEGPAGCWRLRVDDLAAAVDQRTRALAISWVEYANGFRNDLAALGRLCDDKGVFFVVDGIQGLGALQIDVRRYGIHFLAADGHKFLLGPEGAGLLFCARDILDRLEPTNVGWLSVVNAADYGDYDLTLKSTAARFEEGSHNLLGFLGLGASVDLLLEAGVDRIERYLLEYTDRIIEGLRSRGCRIVSSLKPAERSAIVAFQPADESSETAHERLRAANVVCAVREGAVRLSPHFYNDDDDLQRLWTAL